jgi:hypothetical protein
MALVSDVHLVAPPDPDKIVVDGYIGGTLR